MNDLQNLGVKHGTDKADANHSFDAVSFLDVYDSYFKGIRGNVTEVLEIGVHRGQSLRMWRDYFPKAEVWGIDIDPSSSADNGERTHFVLGSQTDWTLMAKVLPEFFDLIIDDGSHVLDHILTSLRLLWERVKPGGFYCIEDLCFSYTDIRSTVGEWPGQSLNPATTNFVNDRMQLDLVLRRIIRDMDEHRGDFAAVHFHPGQIIFQKTA